MMKVKQNQYILFVLLFFAMLPFQNCANQGSAGETAALDSTGNLSLESSGTNTNSTAVPLMEDFSIIPGTGSGPWNTAAKPMIVYVGQKLRITNNDSVSHKMHTGGKPCPHQSTASAPNGGFYDCPIAGEATGTATMKDYVLYDHALGSASKFYLRVYDGQKIYAQKCASCHGALSASEVAGNTVSTISWAKKNVSAMSGITLSAEEIEALEIALRAM